MAHPSSNHNVGCRVPHPWSADKPINCGAPSLCFFLVQGWESTNLNWTVLYESYTDSVTGAWSNLGYDSLNRLSAGTQMPPSGPPQSYCWTYDSFGNRTAQAISNQPFTNAAGATSCQLAGSATLLANTAANYDASNRMTATSQNPNQVNGYDAAGNVTNDGVNSYLYDAEGRICAVANSPVPGMTTMTEYIYDAEGNRVAKGSITSWSCDTTVNGFTVTNSYVLGPSNEQLTETDGNGNWVHTNVYAAGMLIATYNPSGLYFHLSDWLSNRRVQTDYAGNNPQYYQSLPYGEMPPGQDLGATEHHFTGKERDTESGNDYFGARYYASSMGRFMSPDWSAKQEPVPYAKLDNPQSLNLYAYVFNNPLSRFDPDGHCAEHYANGTCKVNVDPSTGAAGAKAGKQLEGVLNKYDKAINGLGDKSKFDIKDAKGNVIGSMTGKEIKAVWNGTSITVTDKTPSNGGAGGATGGSWSGDTFSGHSSLSPGAVRAYSNAALQRDEPSGVGVNTLMFHELAHETHFGQGFNYSYDPFKLSTERESNVSSAGSRMAGTVGAPFDCSIPGGGCK